MYASKLDNLGEMDKFVEKHKLLQLIEEKRANLNRTITSEQI